MNTAAIIKARRKAQQAKKEAEDAKVAEAAAAAATAAAATKSGNETKAGHAAPQTQLPQASTPPTLPPTMPAMKAATMGIAGTGAAKLFGKKLKKKKGLDLNRLDSVVHRSHALPGGPPPLPGNY